MNHANNTVSRQRCVTIAGKKIACVQDQAGAKLPLSPAVMAAIAIGFLLILKR